MGRTFGSEFWTSSTDLAVCALTAVRPSGARRRRDGSWPPSDLSLAAGGGADTPRGRAAGRGVFLGARRRPAQGVGGGAPRRQGRPIALLLVDCWRLPCVTRGCIGGERGTTSARTAPQPPPSQRMMAERRQLPESSSAVARAPRKVTPGELRRLPNSCSGRQDSADTVNFRTIWAARLPKLVTFGQSLAGSGRDWPMLVKLGPVLVNTPAETWPAHQPSSANIDQHSARVGRFRARGWSYTLWSTHMAQLGQGIPRGIKRPNLGFRSSPGFATGEPLSRSLLPKSCCALCASRGFCIGARSSHLVTLCVPIMPPLAHPPRWRGGTWPSVWLGWIPSRS